LTPSVEINGKPVGEDDDESRGFLRENWYRDLWLIVITALVAWALISFEDNQDDLKEVVKSNERLTNQMCRVLVNVHDASVDRYVDERRSLTQTRNYLRNIPEGEEDTQFNTLIRRNLPNAVDEVEAAKQSERATRVPAECTRRDIGIKRR
jgi:hypothetical protein